MRACLAIILLLGSLAVVPTGVAPGVTCDDENGWTIKPDYNPNNHVALGGSCGSDKKGAGVGSAGCAWVTLNPAYRFNSCEMNWASRAPGLGNESIDGVA